jgi:hypothetical protein
MVLLSAVANSGMVKYMQRGESYAVFCVDGVIQFKILARDILRA